MNNVNGSWEASWLQTLDGRNVQRQALANLQHAMFVRTYWQYFISVDVFLDKVAIGRQSLLTTVNVLMASAKLGSLLT